MKKILLFLVLAVTSVIGSHIPQLIASTASIETQESEVRALIERTVGQEGAKLFEISINKNLGFRRYKLTKSQNNKIVIAGWDGISIAKGFHTYLKYYLKYDITWTETNATLPSSLQLPKAELSSKSESPIIYYQNVCTWGYSFAWWSWTDWRKHIDWMAMMGISLTISPIQEEIWYGIYKEFGLTDSEINDFLAGPAFQPWQRMGNIQGWGGPLPTVYRQMQSRLQKRIIDAQRSLGMSVALPAFAGHVPKAMQRLYPNTKFATLERWNKFPDKYCCILFLDPSESLFQTIAQKFLQRTIAAYGSNHIYFTDPFNENQPPSAEVQYMKSAAQNIYQSMTQVDSKAIWLLQGWMFVKNVFWTEELMKAFLTAVPKGRLLVLDLQSEQFPQYVRTRSYEGQPFIWCMLHNFGGTLGMHGSADIVNNRIQSARDMENSTMIGVGITPEGIYQNYVMYALTLERAWKKNNFNLTKWFNQYSDSRYGVTKTSLHNYWNILRQSVYSFHSLKKLRGKYTITRRPGMNLNPWTWYNNTRIGESFHLLLQSHSSIPSSHYGAYEYDLVDITRQYLQVMADEIYLNLIDNFRKRQKNQFKFLAKQLLTVFDDLEMILATNKHFLLGRWLQSAKQWGNTDAEIKLFEFNARNQITTWGPDGQILDYACKQWSGLIRDYYKPRWLLFVNMTTDSLQSNKKFNNALYKERVMNNIEIPFSIETAAYPLVPIGNTYAVAKAIYEKWKSNIPANLSKDLLKLKAKIL